jgi:hypothetical protein
MHPRYVHFLIPATLSLGLFACTNKGTDSDLRMARWVREDTTAVYTVHKFRWESEEGRVFTDVRSSEIQWSRVRVYAMDLAADSVGWRFLEKRLIAQIDHAVPCDDLLFNAADSTVSFSFLPVAQAKPRDCYTSDADPIANPTRRLYVGRVDGSPLDQGLSSVDSAARLALLASSEGRNWTVPFAVPGAWRYCESYDSFCLDVPER